MEPKKATNEASDKGKCPATKSSQGVVARPSKKPSYPMIGKAAFFNEDRLNKYLALSSTKPLPVRLVDLNGFSVDLSLEALFKFQKLLAFLTPKHWKHYPATVKEFYANLIFVEDVTTLKYRSMVHGIAFHIHEDDINDLLNWEDTEIDSTSLIDLLDPKAVVA